MGKRNVYYKHNNESYQKYLDRRYEGQFQLISDYLTENKQVKIKCLKCGHEFDCSRNTLGNTSTSEKCPNCLAIHRKQTVLRRFEEKNPTIKVIEVNYIKKDWYEMTCVCKIHNTVFKRNSKITVESKPSGKPLCPDCIKEYDLKNRILELKAQFPLQLPDNTCIDFYDSYIDNNNKLYIDCIDQYGYKYRVNHNRIYLLSNPTYTTGLQRFFKHNPYTFDNINNYLKLHSIPLTLIDDINYNKGATTEYYFKCNNGVIISQKWNDIHSNPDSYIDIEEKIKNIKKRQMTKERAIEIIRRKENELGRPLLQSDFENTITSDTTVGIRIIYKYWGTFNKMIDELNLLKHNTFYKPNRENYKSHDEIMGEIHYVIMSVLQSGRNTIMVSDFKNICDLEMSTIRRHCKIDNINLNDILNQYDCRLQRCGNGLNHTFDDGETTVSKYEYNFSLFLREQGFIYNKNYFRNIRYDTLDDEYSGNMNCDYCININGILVYVELAGILQNNEHINAYKNNMPIKSKSKETYRLKLNQKREIFEKNKLTYYILLKDDMNENTYKNIIEKYSIEVA